MASQTEGIQQLLAAEKRAAEKISDAKKRKAERLKKAKEEAKEETEKYRLERETQYKDFEAKHTGSREDVASRIGVDTEARIREMTKQVKAHKRPVITKILELVYDIKPMLHKNMQSKK